MSDHKIATVDDYRELYALSRSIALTFCSYVRVKSTDFYCIVLFGSLLKRPVEYYHRLIEGLFSTHELYYASAIRREDIPRKIMPLENDTRGISGLKLRQEPLLELLLETNLANRRMRDFRHRRPHLERMPEDLFRRVDSFATLVGPTKRMKRRRRKVQFYGVTKQGQSVVNVIIAACKKFHNLSPDDRLCGKCANLIGVATGDKIARICESIK